MLICCFIGVRLMQTTFHNMLSALILQEEVSSIAAGWSGIWVYLCMCPYRVAQTAAPLATESNKVPRIFLYIMEWHV